MEALRFHAHEIDRNEKKNALYTSKWFKYTNVCVHLYTLRINPHIISKALYLQAAAVWTILNVFTACIIRTLLNNYIL